MLLRASNGVNRSMASAQFVSVSGLAVERVKEEFGALMRSSTLRQEHLRAALALIHDVRVGRFWDSLGEKTKGTPYGGSLGPVNNR
jgi:hypothetical protein